MEKEDEFAYLNRPGFTAEKFKIELNNLPKYYGMNELKKLLNKKLQLKQTKIKCPKPGSRFAFVCFKNEEEKLEAMEKLNGFKWKGNTLTASTAKPTPDPLVKRRNESNHQETGSKRPKTIEETTTDFVHLTYDDQLKRKNEEICDVLKSHFNAIWTAFPYMKSHFEEQGKKHDGLPCEVLNIKPSPQIDGYRNKCEFTIGKNTAGEKVVGFRLGSYSSGFIEVGSAAGLRNISESMKKAILIFEKFVQNSKLEVFNPEHQSGYFRQLVVRTSRATDELMIIVGIHPQELTEKEINAFKNELVEYFSEGDGKELNVTSLYYQPMPKKVSGVNLPEEHLYGATFITEVIHGLRFRISPGAFFQVNTSCAEILYKTCIDFARATKETTILDVCCGTGTIGLCFAKHVKQVYGMEIVPQAIKDAEANVKENDIENCEFVTGTAEDYITSFSLRAKGTGGDIIAIVDPPRAGLHTKSVLSLRNAKGLNKLIYMSCAPKSCGQNFFDLARPCSKTMRGNPFLPVKAVAIDMFPHTHHTELVVLFERLTDDELKEMHEPKVNEEEEEDEVEEEEGEEDLQQIKDE